MQVDFNLRPNIRYLRERANLLGELRAFFDLREFLEVQPPCLSRVCVVDPYIDPLAVDSAQLGIAQPGLPEKLYLQTSPEAAMKRLLAAGAPSIYSIGPVFRSGEEGAMHNVEFTMLEWYEVGGDLASGVQLLGDLATKMLGFESFETTTYRLAFQQAIGIDPIEVSDADLEKLIADVDPTLAKTVDDRDDRLDVLMSERVQPHLGLDQPTIVTDYPISQAALAKPSPSDDACASRFELFVRGVELANGYDELLDADVLIQRAETTNAKRIESGRKALPVETPLVDAMRSGFPQSAGVALGVDRLLMLRTDVQCIDDVMPFKISFA